MWWWLWYQYFSWFFKVTKCKHRLKLLMSGNYISRLGYTVRIQHSFPRCVCVKVCVFFSFSPWKTKVIYFLGLCTKSYISVVIHTTVCFPHGFPTVAATGQRLARHVGLQWVYSAPHSARRTSPICTSRTSPDFPTHYILCFTCTHILQVKLESLR